MTTRRTVRRPGSKVAPPGPVGFSPQGVFRGLCFSLFFALILFLLWSVLFSFTTLPDKYMTHAAYATSFLAVMVGGRQAARRAGGAGILHGVAVALIYALLLGAVAAITTMTPFAFGLKGLTRPLLDLVAGILGGLLGGGR